MRGARNSRNKINMIALLLALRGKKSDSGNVNAKWSSRCNSHIETNTYTKGYAATLCVTVSRKCDTTEFSFSFMLFSYTGGKASHATKGEKNKHSLPSQWCYWVVGKVDDVGCSTMCVLLLRSRASEDGIKKQTKTREISSLFFCCKCCLVFFSLNEMFDAAVSS